MGEIAEMMLEGILCEQCGEYVGDPVGYTVLCDGCARPRLPIAKKTATQKRRERRKRAKALAASKGVAA